MADGLGKEPPDEQSSQLRQMVQDLRQVGLLGFMLQADCCMDQIKVGSAGLVLLACNLRMLLTQGSAIACRGHGGTGY